MHRSADHARAWPSSGYNVRDLHYGKPSHHLVGSCKAWQRTSSLTPSAISLITDFGHQLSPADSSDPNEANNFNCFQFYSGDMELDWVPSLNVLGSKDYGSGKEVHSAKPSSYIQCGRHALL